MQPKTEKTKKKISRQPSIEEDAMFIRKTIEEIERGSSSRLRDPKTFQTKDMFTKSDDRQVPSTSKSFIGKNSKINDSKENKVKELDDDVKDDSKRKDADKGNGKKKSKSRARLEREQSKPSETDTEPDVDTVTVEIPRRRKRPRRASERPRTPPISLHSDSEEEVR